MLETRLEEVLSKVELSPPKYGALNQLVQAGKPLMLGELAARLTCVRSNITQLVDRLEADGLVERVEDPTLAKGKTVVEEEGSSPSRTTATREIYAADGALIRSETWTTSYEGENRVIRVGTKIVTKPVAPKSKSRSDDEAPVATSPTPKTPRP